MTAAAVHSPLMDVDALIARLETERWTIGVIGLGYVGLPLAVTAVERGLDAVGFDVSVEKVAALAAGRSPVEDVPDDQLAGALAGGLSVTTDEADLAAADMLVICVPSPLGRNRQPDMSYIESAAATVSRVARPGHLVSLESTTYPGTTEDILVPAVEAAGLTPDVDVFVAFSPERIDPGSTYTTGAIPKVVGGHGPVSARVAEAAYGRLVDAVHPVSSAAVAEMAKLLENTYRAVNIGLVNEMAQLADELDIDIWEVIAAASTKPFGFQAFYPGPGVGGHCIPLDPHFLAWRAKEANFTTKFIDIAEQVNGRMPHYTADRVGSMLNEAAKPVFGSRVLGVGVAYKPNIGDDRESAAIHVLDELARRGAVVEVFDPLVDDDRIRRHGYEPAHGFEGYDAAVILTDHDVIDYQALVEAVPLVFDARDALRRRGIDAPHATRL
jgi:UDP-N-acetyl-D-glucosamine dehydrogenase